VWGVSKGGREWGQSRHLEGGVERGSIRRLKEEREKQGRYAKSVPEMREGVLGKWVLKKL